MDVESEEKIMPNNLMDLAETIEKLTEEENCILQFWEHLPHV